MSASLTAHSLLSLPSEVTDPGPYAVFGLRPGESDSAVIAQAMKMTIARLNAAKPHADPAAWKQAAVWVKRARGILLDPAQKAQLDQAGGSAGAAATPGAAAAEMPPAIHAEVPRRGGDSAPAATEPAVGDDPLAGLLPGLGTAGAAQQHSRAPVFRAGPARSPGSGDRHGNTSGPPAPSPVEGGRLHAGSAYPPSPPVPASRPMSDWDPAASDQPQVPTPSAESLPNAGPLPIQIVKADAGPISRRRRRFPWASVVLTLLTVVCIAGMAGVIYMLSQNSGGIVISLQPRAAESPAGDAVAAAPPAQSAEDQPPFDPIMGRLGPKREPSTSRDPDRLAAADNWLATLPDSAEPAMDPAMDPEPSPAAAGIPTDSPQPQDPATEPAARSAAADAAAGMPASAPSPLANGASSPASADAAQVAVDKAHQAIKAADWATMTSLAEAAEQAAVTAEQKTKAAQLFQLAELATYYHGAIEKGLEGLGAGESFNVTEQLQIVVVEVAEEKVVFRFSGRNKDYPRRELPLVLAHRIARFALPADAPASVAAAHAYQAVAPVSTPQYRQQAIDALEAMPQQVEGAEPTEIANAIRDVFGE